MVLLFQASIKPDQVKKETTSLFSAVCKHFQIIPKVPMCCVSRTPPEVSDVADDSCSHDGQMGHCFLNILSRHAHD